MAVIGVSKPYVAVYRDNGDGTVAYAEGARLAMATEVEISIESGSSNNLYADNVVAETDREFGGGTLTLGVDDLSPEKSKMILGLKESKVTIGGEEITELVYDDDAVTPYMGFGCIIKRKKDGGNRWRAVVLTKIMFSIPPDSATTQGDAVEWQTPSIEAAIMRDDTEKHRWKREATFETEAQAEQYLQHVLQVAPPPVVTARAARKE